MAPKYPKTPAVRLKKKTWMRIKRYKLLLGAKSMDIVINIAIDALAASHDTKAQNVNK